MPESSQMAARIGVMARKPAATGWAGESGLGSIGEGSTIWLSLSHGCEFPSASQRVLKERELRPQHAVGTALEPRRYEKIRYGPRLRNPQVNAAWTMVGRRSDGGAGCHR